LFSRRSFDIKDAICSAWSRGYCFRSHAFAAVFVLGALMVAQVNQLANDLPGYQSTLKEIQSLRGAPQAQALWNAPPRMVREIHRLYKEQKAKERKQKQLTLFEVKKDCRPASQGVRTDDTASRRFSNARSCGAVCIFCSTS